MNRIKLYLGVVVVATLFMFGGTYAANDVANTPKRIDTFGSDVAIITGRGWVENLTITAYTSAKTVTFIDDDGDECLVLEVPAGYTISWPTEGAAPKEFANGFNFDDSASDLAANDFIFVWTRKARY
jgi:hypothetical protein